MTADIDLRSLPPPKVVETLSAQKILAEMRDYLSSWAEKNGVVFDLRESDPAMRILEVFAYREVMLRQRINDAALECMLAFASGSNLAHLAALFGVGRAPAEPDASLRLRASEAPDRLSTAGSAVGYRRVALDVSPSIADVGVVSERPGEVRLLVLPRYGLKTEDAAALISAVRRRFLDEGEDVRPIGDRVSVEAAKPRQVDLRAVIHVGRGFDKKRVLSASEARLRAGLILAHRVGRILSLSELYAALHGEGVERVELPGLQADVTVAPDEAAEVPGYRIWSHDDPQPEKATPLSEIK